MTSKPTEHEITQTIGIVFLRHPELAERVSYDELRRLAMEGYAPPRNHPRTIPAYLRGKRSVMDPGVASRGAAGKPRK